MISNIIQSIINQIKFAYKKIIYNSDLGIVGTLGVITGVIIVFLLTIIGVIGLFIAFNALVAFLLLFSLNTLFDLNWEYNIKNIVSMIILYQFLLIIFSERFISFKKIDKK